MSRWENVTLGETMLARVFSLGMIYTSRDLIASCANQKTDS
jgi:hypothetical protein